MIVDLLHNKIVAATVSESFTKSFKEKLLPKLSSKYGDSITYVQMYEDHIADGFSVGGEFYYPLTVVTENVNTQWIKWRIAKGKFAGNSPYAFTGDSLDFTLVDDVPKDFSDKLSGRRRFFEYGSVKMRVETTLQDVTLLSGKYSQTFVDEMAEQLTSAIEEAMSCEGLSKSNLELCLIFAPESYMEHTSENVTYRRLLLTDNSGAPRDFWIKWTRLDAALAYSVAANPDSSSVVFEIGEDVSQKVREKEYRFLLSTKGKDKYHNAMGRKNITEWREIIKRAIRRGELTKIETEEVISKETEDLTRQLLSVVGTDLSSSVEEVVASKESDEELKAALEFARCAIEAEKEIEDEDLEEEQEAEDELDEFYKEEADVPSLVKFDEEEEREVDELSRLAKEELIEIRSAELSFDDEEGDGEFSDADEDFVVPAELCDISLEYTERDPDTAEESEEDALDEESEPLTESDIIIVPEDPTAEEYSEIEDEESLEDEENEEALLDLEALDGSEPYAEEDVLSTTEEPVVPIANEPAVIDTRLLEEKIRAEVESKLRLEYERDARRRAEEEAQRLRKENEKLLIAAKNEEARKAQREKERLEEAEKLKTQIEAQLRAEARERERLAEAARAAVEEQRRLEEEKARVERMRLEEERRREAEARARALEEERSREAERIRRETEERIRAEYEKKEKEALSLSKNAAEESSESKETAEPQSGYVNPNYTYVSKNVKLLFRRSVDPNITGRIHEIIKATLDYYGKSKVYLKIKATVPDTSTVILEFVKIPMEEMELLGNIIKVLGNSGLGIAKAIIE